MKSILVATDGSATADRAVKIAAELAAAEAAGLTIVNVRDSKSLGDAEQHFAEVEYSKVLENRGSDLNDEMRLNLLRLAPREVLNLHDRQSLFLRECVSAGVLAHAEAIARRAGVAEPVTVSIAGDAAGEIVATSERIGADLVVVGRRGLSSVAELLLGSVSQKVLHRAHTNVMTVA
jgi:nucleotide-binding universal stress UspA family protein